MLPAPPSKATGRPEYGYSVISGQKRAQLTHMAHAISKDYTRALCHA